VLEVVISCVYITAAQCVVLFEDELSLLTHLCVTLLLLSCCQMFVNVLQGRLDPNDIDAYWLQRGLSRYYPDADASAKLSEEVCLYPQYFVFEHLRLVFDTSATVHVYIACMLRFVVVLLSAGNACVHRCTVLCSIVYHCRWQCSC
jgi:N-terminal helicase PWI domain